MSSGYSGTPLAKKLGLKAGMALALIDPPPNYWELVAPAPEGLRVRPVEEGGLGCIHIFVTSAAQLAARIGELRGQIAPSGMIWVSWPKRAAKVATDVTEETIRALALASGLVDVKVCAIDATWSGLKLVIPLKERH